MSDELHIKVSPMGYINLFVDDALIAPSLLRSMKFKKVRITEWINGKEMVRDPE